MTHLENRSALAQRVTRLLSSLSDLDPPPRPYQIEEWRVLVAWLSDPNGTRRSYFSQATGLGKTYLFASLLRYCAGLRALIVVPTKALLQQTAEKVVASTGGLIGHISSIPNVHDRNGETIAIRGHEHSDVVITTEASFKLYDEMLAKEFEPSLILWDECHRAYTQELQNSLGQFPEAVIIGLSATPDYLGTAARNGYVPVKMENGLTLYGNPNRFARTHFQTMLSERTVRWGIESGWLAPFAWGRIEFDASLDNVPLTEGEFGLDYDASSLQKLMAKHWTVMCETIRRLYANSHYDLLKRQSFAICPGVEEAQQLAETINGLGVAAACITGDNPDAERTAILKAYDHRDIQFISSVMVLREGWDAPSAEVGLMLRLTKSRLAYIQGMGRLLRIDPNGAHKVALVLDAHFQSGKFAPLSAPVIFGKDKVVADGILCGPKREGLEIESPYLPKNAEPRLVVIDALDTEWVHGANTDGFIESEGRIWGLISAIAKKFGICNETIRKKILILKICPLNGNDCRGVSQLFYPLDVLSKEFASTLAIKHKAGVDGFVKADGYKWGNLRALSGVLGIQPNAIKRRLDERVMTRQAMDLNHVPRLFYRLDQIKKVCADIITVKRRADANGLFEADGHVWAGFGGLEVELKISRSAIRHRLNKCGVESCEAIDKVGRPRKFYRLDHAKKACTDLISVDHKADDDGFFEADGYRWGLVNALEKTLGISGSTIKKRCRVGKTSNCHGLDHAGKLQVFYRLDQAKKACTDLISVDHKADDDGFFEADGYRWGLVNALEKALGISGVAIKNRLKNKNVRSRYGIDHVGKRQTFYRLDQVEKICNDLVSVEHRADENGFFKADGHMWGMAAALSRKIGLSDSTIRKRVAEKGLTGLRGRNHHGIPYEFYRLDQVEKICNDLVGVEHRADENGFFKAGGHMWGNLRGLSVGIGVLPKAIKKCIAGHRLGSCKGRDVLGNLRTFYRLDQVKKACAHLLKKRKG